MSEPTGRTNPPPDDDAVEDIAAPAELGKVTPRQGCHGATCAVEGGTCIQTAIR